MTVIGDGEDAARRERLERDLALLEGAAAFLASVREPADIYPAIVRAAAVLVSGGRHRWRAAYLNLEGDVLRTVAAHDDASLTVGSGVYPLSEYPALRRVIETREPMHGDAMLLSAGVPEDTAQRVRSAALMTALLVPVGHGAEIFGLLGLSTPDSVADDDVPFRRLGAVAHLGGLAIANARLFAEQQQVAEQARAVELMKSRVLNLAAHEMRAPLTVLQGYTDMLSDGSLGPVTDRMGEVLTVLQAKIAEMNRLVDEIVETARLEDGRLELHRTRLDLRDVAHAALAMMEPLLGAGHPVTLVDCADPMPVDADAMRLTTVLTNLLDNAGKYSAVGSPIEVRCAIGAGQATVAVVDRGIGLRQEDMAVLFTRFGRVVGPSTSHIPGTGLGLWLSREITRMHGGDIEVSSREGEGSTFTVVLPMLES